MSDPHDPTSPKTELAPHLVAARLLLAAEWPDGGWKAGDSPETLVGTCGGTQVTLVYGHANWMAFSPVGKGLASTPVMAAIKAVR